MFKTEMNQVKSVALFLFGFLFINQTWAQERTVGTTNFEPGLVTEGYNLIYPHFQPNVYLLDLCGRVVHQWEDTASTPGNIAYLGTEGNLYKAKKLTVFAEPTFGAGGAGGIVELRSWDNDLIWSRKWADTVYRQHHDLEVLPNGNVLLFAWEYQPHQSALAIGADTAIWPGIDIWSEAIFEVNPSLDSIVWEWHAWDHTVQSVDSTLSNFGAPNTHPEKIHLNYASNATGRSDWLHFNSIDYNADLDQILISTPFYDEVWIIDHSTTTAEAATGSGGNANKGGDLLYRWGNPEAYALGSKNDRQLFFQHDANWIDDDISEGHRYKGMISIFNNRFDDSLSTAIIIDPMYDEATGTYPFLESENYAPEAPSLYLQHPDPVSMFSSGLSSIQVLDNDNFLICSGRNGYAFEMDEDQNLFWEFRTPLIRGTPVAQGTRLEINDNITFKVRRYAPDYPGLNLLNVPSEPLTIETENPLDFCALLTPLVNLPEFEQIQIYPNPAQGSIEINMPDAIGENLFIVNTLGQIVLEKRIVSDNSTLDVSSLAKGIYFVSIEQRNAIGRLVINRN